MLRWISSGIILIFLAGCGHESVGRDFEFDNSKSYALLAYDISYLDDPFPNFSFYMFPYNEETGTIDEGSRTDMGCGFVCSRGNEEVRFYLKPINPGTYVLGYALNQSGFKRTILCYSRQTVKIDPEPGTILYLGELTLSMDHPNGLVMDKLEVTSHDEAHVKARLAKYPHILEVDPMYRPNGKMRRVRNDAEPGEIKIAPVEYVAFERGEAQEDACIKDYLS